MATDSYAYLEKVITDPETAIVQEQIQGNSAKMLIILPDGDQKLIVFDCPLENCTVLTLLEQASIPYNSGTTISLVHDPTEFGINYIVEVQSLVTEEEIAASNTNIPPKAENCIPSTLPVEEPRYCPGMLAVCPYCGFLSETFHKCQRCKRKLPENVKSVCDRYGHKETKKKTFLSENFCKESEGPPLKTPKLERDNGSFRDSLETEESQSSRDDKIEQESCTNYSKENVVYEVEDNLIKREEREGLELYMESDNLAFEESIHIKLACRTVRIGSYKYVPPEDAMISEHGLRLIVPCLEDDKQMVKIDIMYEDIIRVLIHFGRHLPVLFFFTSTRVGERVRNILGMEDPTFRYYDPASKDGTHKRITLLPHTIGEDSRKLLKHWFETKLEELNLTEANEILVRATPKILPILKRSRTTRYSLPHEHS